jgi:hypothetical protein
VLVVGWFSVAAGLVAVATASQVLGKPVWWVSLDGPRWPHTIAVLVLPVVALVAAGRRLSWWQWASWSAVASTALVAVLDRTDSPGAALATGALAAGSTLFTVGAALARPTGTVPTSPGSTSLVPAGPDPANSVQAASSE